jgi:hypothetical protein
MPKLRVELLEIVLVQSDSGSTTFSHGGAVGWHADIIHASTCARNVVTH